MLSRNSILKPGKPLQRKTPLQGGKPLNRSREPKGPGLAQRIAASLGRALGHQHSEPSVFRSPRHRKNVAAMRCICCGRPGASQAAHLNLLALGKGRGWKLSDALTIPLCVDRIGVIGCHVRLDSSGQYDKGTSAALQIHWLGETRDRLCAAGQWPEAAEADFQRFVVTYLERAA
ncbi:hypothetical protein KVP10_08430 [Candidimonas humi]|uniref:Uncharacterized protein n=1 Tax=Candidimonas humi TaxID=683355 RepID=A0ABV8NUR4_9BURK|nr:hypothetical protein [Candidimonas humi]MBV6304912.1 hypothetical protein [Candidimonas humi]